MVVTSVALAGICLGSRFGTAFTVVEMKESKLTASAVYLQFVRSMLSGNKAFCSYEHVGREED